MNKETKDGLCSDVLRFILLDISREDIGNRLLKIKSNLDEFDIIELTNQTKIKLERFIHELYYEGLE